MQAVMEADNQRFTEAKRQTDRKAEKGRKQSNSEGSTRTDRNGGMSEKHRRRQT